MAMAAPLAVDAAEAAGARVAAGKGASKAAGKAAPKSGKGSPGTGPGGPGQKAQKGDFKRRAEGRPKGGGSKLLAGSAGKYRKMMIAEFLICVILLGLSPLAKKSDLGPVRFMKRGTATCAFFIILGLVSSAGKGAAKAAATFGALVTLVLLVDQRGIFGQTVQLLNKSADDDQADADKASAPTGPDDSVSVPDQPEVADT